MVKLISKTEEKRLSIQYQAKSERLQGLLERVIKYYEALDNLGDIDKMEPGWIPRKLIVEIQAELDKGKKKQNDQR